MDSEMQDHRQPSERIADDLLLGFLSGEFAPGDQLPSVGELTKEYGVAPNTVQNAMRILKDKGLVYSVKRQGTFVRPEARVEDFEASRPEGSPWFQQILSRLDSIGDEIASISDRLAHLENRQDGDASS